MHALAKPRPKKAESAAIKAKPALQGNQIGLFLRIFTLKLKAELEMISQMIFGDFYLS